MAEAYIVDAVRTPVGGEGRRAQPVHPADLGAHASRALVDRTGIDPAAVEDVIFGCVDTIGPQAGDIARTCWLAAGLPDDVPGHDRRPAVRLVAAGRALRRPGGDERDERPGRRRRRAEHEHDPDQRGDDRRRPLGFDDPFTGPRAGGSATATRRSRSSSAPR